MVALASGRMGEAKEPADPASGGRGRASYEECKASGAPTVNFETSSGDNPGSSIPTITRVALRGVTGSGMGPVHDVTGPLTTCLSTTCT